MAGGVGIGGALNLPNVTVATNGRISTTENVFCSFLRSTNDVGGTGNIEAEGDVIVGGNLFGAFRTLREAVGIVTNQRVGIPSNFKMLRMVMRDVSTQNTGVDIQLRFIRSDGGTCDHYGTSAGHLAASNALYQWNIGNMIIGRPGNTEFSFFTIDIIRMGADAFNNLYVVSGMGQNNFGYTISIMGQVLSPVALPISFYEMRVSSGNIDAGQMSIYATY